MKYFSIIIPIYNAEKYLKTSLDSILNQSFTDYELILVNDGSTDDSEKICKEYTKKDNRVILITTQNQGSGPARNEGIKKASGKFCYFPDGDDLLVDNALQNIYEETKKHDADLYVFAYYLARRNGTKKLKQEREPIFVTGNKARKEYDKYMRVGKTYIQGAPWNKVFKTENIKNNNIKYPSLKRNQDEVFIVRYMNTVKDIKFSNKTIYVYFVNDTLAEWNKFPKNYLDIRTEVYKEFYKNVVPWNEKNYNTKYNINFTFVDNVLKCFEYMFSPKWEMDKKSKKEYIKESIERTEVKESVKFVLKNKKEIREYLRKECNIQTYKINLILYKTKLMKKCKINRLYNISKLMIQLRKAYNKLKYGGK